MNRLVNGNGNGFGLWKCISITMFKQKKSDDQEINDMHTKEIANVVIWDIAYCFPVLYCKKIKIKTHNTKLNLTEKNKIMDMDI